LELVISDAHTGLKVAIARVFDASWQRCRVHWMRNALAHVPKARHTVVAAAIRQAFTQPDPKAATEVWRHVADQLRPRWPKLAALMDDSEADVLAYMAFPAQHRTKLHSTNPLERLNKEVKRRANVVGIFPNEDSKPLPLRDRLDRKASMFARVGVGRTVGGRGRFLFRQGQHQGARFQPVSPTHQPRRRCRLVQRRAGSNHHRQKRAELSRDTDA
jgi:hypothetical protein